jgi:hypothetical protein
MMWMSSTTEGKIQEQKTIAKHHNAWRWASAKKGPTNGLPSKEWMINKSSKGNGS